MPPFLRRPDLSDTSRVRHTVLLLLFVVTTVNYADRATLSIAGSELSKQLGLSKITMGYAFSAFGWAFRPVLIEIEVWQLTGCEQPVWIVREFALLGHKYFEAYPEREQKKKEVQLEANLTKVMEELSRRAGESLRLQACQN